MKAANIASEQAKNDPFPGLTSAEVDGRLRDIGPNAIPKDSPHPVRLILSKFWAPVPCLLEAAIILQLVVGEYVEASIIGLLLAFNAVIGSIHESRAQATIAALKSRLALYASVRRDGVWKTILAANLVPGDIIKLSLGAVVAADVRLLEGSVLLDQSMLTGESLPIEGEAGRETYAGVLVRRGEAVAEVTATGPRTKFSRTAELVRTAHAISSQQRAVFRIVRNLAVFNGIVCALMLAYAAIIGLSAGQILQLFLVAVLASIPVALPATFTLATAIGAQALAKRGVLSTRLSAVDEAGTLDILCSDKTGTLTQNELAVTEVRPLLGHSRDSVLALAAMASSEGGADPIDAAIRAANFDKGSAETMRRTDFVPFDPALKLSTAKVIDGNGAHWEIVKGAFSTIAEIVGSSSATATVAADLEARGYRVLAVAVGAPKPSEIAGLIAFSDPPREDAKPLIQELRQLGVRTVMVTGDAATTAGVVADAVGIEGTICPHGTIAETTSPQDYGIFAGVLPEDKYRLVKAFQGGGHVVGMCGDGANDAPALRQAQIGIAVSTATDVAKSAAGLVLTEAGLAGIVTAVKEGRITFQRIFTYALRSIVAKSRQVLFLMIGLIMTGQAVLTPMLMVLSMITGDFLSMSSTTDNVLPSAKPNVWRINNLTVAGVLIGAFDLIFCTAALAVGFYLLHLDTDALRTMTLVTIVYNGQAIFYIARARGRMWSSRPSIILILSSVADLSIVTVLALTGFLMAPLAPIIVGGLFLAAVAMAFVLDQIKLWLFARLAIL